MFISFAQNGKYYFIFLLMSWQGVDCASHFNINVFELSLHAQYVSAMFKLQSNCHTSLVLFILFEQKSQQCKTHKIIINRA